jgi:long-chain acyl-CoA synthetase
VKITQAVHRAVQIRGQALATVFGERRRTWSELHNRISRYAAGLKALGLQRGDRVAIIAHNSDLYVETYFAVAWAGGVAVPGNFRWNELEHRYALQESTPRFLIVDKSFAGLARSLAEACAFSRVLLLDAGDGPGDGDLVLTEELIRSNEPTEDVSGQYDDLCAIFYTGGTTGRSKGVMLSHRNLMWNIFALCAMTPIPADPIFLHLPPMFHLADAGAVLTISFYAGTHVIMPAFTPATTLDAIEKERVTMALMVPAIFRALLECLKTRPADLSSMRRIRYGTSTISESLLRDAMQMFPNAEFQQGYGQTELSPTCTVLEPRFHTLGGKKSYLRSAGRAVMGTDVRIVDDALVERPLGQVGEIVARGPGVMLGYWNQPELTAATIVDGWVRTGDAGYMDEEGFIYVVDRLKDMIVSGGENVFSAEVENALNAHAAIAECAVIAVPDPKWGERVHAIVRFKAGTSATAEELVAHCKSMIAGYKCPRSIEVRSEPLPLSPQGKILKSELRKSYWAGHDRSVG